MSFTARITVALLLVVLLPIVTIGIGAIWWTEKVLIDRSLFHLKSVAEMQRDRIHGLVERNLERHALVASRTQLRTSLRAFVETRDPAHLTRMTRILDDARSALPEVERISVVSPDGHIVASTDRLAIGTTPVNRGGTESPPAGEFVYTPRDTTYGLWRSADGEVKATLSGELRLEGESIGQLIIDVSARDLLAVVRDFSGLRETGETLLARREGNGAALLLMGTRFEPDAALRHGIRASATDVPVIRALNGLRDTFADTVDYRQVPVLSATSYIPSLGWGVVAKMDRAEVLGTTEDVRFAAIGMLIGTSILVAFLVFSISRSLRTPLRALLNAATTVGSGDLSSRVQLPAGTEFAEIGAAFNHMTDRLSESRAAIERESKRRQRIEQRYRKIIESAPTAMILCAPDGRIELVNQAAERLFDYTRGELVGKPIEILLPDRVAAVHPAHRRAYFHAPTSRAMGEGRDLAGRRKDGTEVPVEIGLNPIHTDEGTLVLSAILDLTERRRFESDLMRQNQRLAHDDWLKTGQTDLAGSMRAVADVDALTEEVLDFFCRYLGIQAGAVYVRSAAGPLTLRATRAVSRLAPPRQFALGEGLVGQAALDRERRLLSVVPEGYMSIESGLGSSPPACVAVVPLVHGQRTIAVMELATLEPMQSRDEELFDRTAESIAIAIDVALKAERLEELLEESQEKSRALEQASAYKSAFLANMSHELRTPLNSVLLLAGNLAANEDGQLAPEQQHSAAIIERSGRSLLALINDILDMSKIEAGRLDIVPVAVELRELVDEVIEQYLPIATQRALELTATVAEAVPTHIVTDRQRLSQILTNLLSNALKFTAEGSVRLDVSVAETHGDPRVHFAVVDTGIGIPEAHQEIVFGAFNQVDRSRSREFGGTGLGLSISQQLAGLLDGEISLVSTPGAGSTFTLTLPARTVTDGVSLVESGSPATWPALAEFAAQPRLSAPAANGPPPLAEDGPQEAAPGPGLLGQVSDAFRSLAAPPDEAGLQVLLIDNDMRRAFGLASRLSAAAVQCEIVPSFERACVALHEATGIAAVLVAAEVDDDGPQHAAQELAGRLGRALGPRLLMISPDATSGDDATGDWLPENFTAAQLRTALRAVERAAVA